MILSLRFSILVAALWWLPRLLAAQQLDPSFQAAYVYDVGSVRQVGQQADGKQVLLGTFARVGHQDAPPCGLARLLANSTRPESVFLQNVLAINGYIRQFLLLSSGKMLLAGANGPGPLLQSGSVSRQALLLLNADGTPDATFNAGAGPNAFVQHMVEQPDGKILLGGAFTQFDGQSVAGLVRLNPNGSLDVAFQAAVFPLQNSAAGAGGQPPAVYFMALQPDGKLLLGGRFGSPVAAGGYRGIVRLLPTGQRDAGFQTPATLTDDIFGLAVQPDGRILTLNASGILYRFLASGAIDPGFQAGLYGRVSQLSWPAGSPLVQVQPGTGRILVASVMRDPPAQQPDYLTGLLPSGGIDPSFNNQSAASGVGGGKWVEMLATGELLVGGVAAEYGGTRGQLTPMALLNPTGNRNQGFAPLVQNYGVVADLLLQPDGKILVAGSFTEINGAVAHGLARLAANGEPDTAFCRRAATDGSVGGLALQPDGKIWVGGRFGFVGGSSQRTVARLLPTGQRDATASPAIGPGGTTPATADYVSALRLQPDGKLFVAGSVTWVQAPGSTAWNSIARLLPAGQLDTSFQPGASAWSGEVADMILQPDGKLVAAGVLRSPTAPQEATVWRWMSNGTLDPAFTALDQRGTLFINAIRLCLDGQGRVYAGGTAGSAGNLPPYVVRLRANGTPDPTFNAVFGGTNGEVIALALQPNQRLLVSSIDYNALTQPAVRRLLTDGSPDASFQSQSGPNQSVGKVVVQPDGAILLGGGFTSVAGLPTNALARMIDANVLAIRPQQQAAQVEAWPVPVHGILHVGFGAADQPQRLTVLDTTGRALLMQRVTNAAEATLDTSALPAGLYLLRVDYATGSVGRCVVVE